MLPLIDRFINRVNNIIAFFISGPYAAGSVDIALQGGYLAMRTAPSFNYENEIIHNGPRNGQLVQIVGEYVQGTGLNGVPATYVRVYSPDFNITGLVNAAYIG